MTSPALLRRLLAALGTTLLIASGGAAAEGLPPAYGAIVVQPVGLPARAEFDLTEPLARARRENKSLYVYHGARDCRFCRKYEAFLDQNSRELQPHFAAKYLVVDLRSSLQVPAKSVFIKAGASSLSYTDFQTSIGDERVRALVYPTVWLLDAALKPLIQMPSGAGTFQTVPEQLEILRLEQ